MHHDDTTLTRWTRLGRLLSKGLSKVLPVDAAMHFEVKSHRVYVPNLPEAFESFRIVQLSDVHFYEYSCPAYHQSVVDGVNALEPDVVVTTGDIIHYGHKYLGFGESFLKQIRARVGKWSCMGNHDYSDDFQGQAVRRMLYEAGFQVLVNEAVAVEKEGKRLWISGVDDCKKGRPDPEQAYHNIEPDDIHVSLMHNPRFAPHLAVQQLAPHLILSGHTHGGQVKHFLVNWAHIHLFENPYQYGWFTFLNHSQLYVTSGVGSASVAVHTPAFDFSLYPFRVNTTAEVAVFELTGQPIVEASSLEMPEILTLIR